MPGESQSESPFTLPEQAPAADGDAAATEAVAPPVEAPPPALFGVAPAISANGHPAERTTIPRGRRPWVASLALAVLVSGGGLGLLYSDDVTSQRNANDLQAQKRSLLNQNESLQSQLTSTQTTLTASQAQVTALQNDLKHPTLGIWNVKQNLHGGTDYLVGGVPDTFTYHLKVTSTGPMSVSILSFQQFAAAIDCVQVGRGNTNFCMHHSGTYGNWSNVTTVDFDFHDAEGCAGYMSVFTSAGPVVVSPDVSVTYNPAPKGTGVCA